MIDKQYIIKTATGLFKQKGLKNTTMDDLANHIGISKKTLYQHICDRKELIEFVISTEYKSLENNLKTTQSNSSDSIEELIRVNVFVLNFLKQINSQAINDLKKQYIELYLSSKEQFSGLFMNVLRENIRRGISNEVYLNDIDVDVIIGIHSDRIEKMLDSNNLYEAKQSAPETIKKMITYYIRGLVTKKGQGILEKHIIKFDKYLV